ncbi:PAS domain S-box protein [Plasticicumulans sp.]|uniref:PAS domain S-box protein n=1 Tax=Plasticicumulans sp. TaxID=2307179 RepID=UPI00394F1393
MARAQRKANIEATSAGNADERRSWLPALATLIGGLLLTAAIFLLLASGERERAHDEFERAARDRFLSVARELEQGLTGLQGLAAFVYTNPGMSAEAFDALSRHLLGLSPGLDTLAWAARDTQGGGDRYLLSRLYPAEGASLVAGADLLARPEFAATVLAARDGGRLALSEPFPRGGDGESRGVLAAVPVYRTLISGADERRRRQDIVGVAIAVLDPQRLVEGALSRLDPVKVELRLFDLGAPRGRQLLYHPLGSLRGAAMASYLADPEAFGAVEHLQRRIEIAQREWLVVATPAPGQFFASLGSRPWWALGVGLALTLAVAFWLRATVGRHGQVEAMVALREAELSESALRFHQLTEGAPLVLWISSIENGQMLYLSPAFESIWGFTPEQVFQRPGLRRELVHPEDRDRLRRLVRSAAQNEGYDTEYRIQRQDGELRWIRERAHAVRNAAGVVYRLAGLSEDVTAQHRHAAEAAVRDARLRASFESLPEAVLIVGSSGCIESMNPAAERQFGYAADELLGGPVAVLLPGYDPLAPLDPSRPQSGVRRGGGRFPALVPSSDYDDDNGRHHVCLVHDLTALGQSQTVSSRERERAQAILSSITEAVVTTDALGRVDFLSPLAERMTGWNSAQALGQPLPSVLRLRDPLSGLERGDLMLSAGASEVLRLVRRDGSELAVHCSVAPIRSLGQDVGGVVLVLRAAGSDAPGEVQAGQPSEPSEVLDSFGRDALTGLPDRPGFVAKLDNALEAVQAGGAPRTLIYLTLRQMHSLTALGGEAMADRVRAGAAQALIDVLGPRDVAGRVGADEFALLLEGWNAETLPEQLAEIRAALGQYSMEVQGRTHRVDADIGAIPVNADSGDSLDVMSAADLACHRARVAARSGS